MNALVTLRTRMRTFPATAPAATGAFCPACAAGPFIMEGFYLRHWSRVHAGSPLARIRRSRLGAVVLWSGGGLIVPAAALLALGIMTAVSNASVASVLAVLVVGSILTIGSAICWARLLITAPR